MAGDSLLSGKCGLIVGVANAMSIAWHIAEAAASQGARLAFTYQGEVLAKRVRPLAQKAGGELVTPCDVESEEQLDALFEALSAKWNRLDFIVHSVAFAERQDLRGAFVETSRAGFLRSLDVSCYSLTALCRRALPLMRNAGGGSVLTLSYYGAEKAAPSYNVMGVAKAALEASVRYLAADLGADGIRVNALSAGPLRTLASSAVDGFRHILHWTEDNAPLRRNITGADVAGSALYLLSDLASGVSGEVLHVDCGTHAVLGLGGAEALRRAPPPP